MNQYSFTDNDLRLAAGLVRASMLDAVRSIPSGDREFSESFLVKMDELLTLDVRRSRRNMAWRRVASIFIAFLLGASLLLATNPGARATFFAWVREVYEHSVIYHYFGQSNNSLPRYEPSWIPDGFTLEQESEEIQADSAWRDMVYANPQTGDAFIFTCQTMTTDSATALIAYDDSTVSEPEHCVINGMEAVYHPPETIADSSNLLWFDQEHGLVLSVIGTLEKSVTLHIAESVSLSELTK